MPSAVVERLKAQLAQSGAEIASAVASANALARKMQSEVATAAWAEAVATPSASRRSTLSALALPDPSEMPAALGAAMQELSRQVYFAHTYP